RKRRIQGVTVADLLPDTDNTVVSSIEKPDGGIPEPTD
ncbi:MAG: hypothetical protein QOI66_2972, partial [Myxococcales bacterium]|nr:hypothetical protein [Myxococcales bacterium]